MRNNAFAVIGVLASFPLLAGFGDDPFCSGLKTITENAGDNFSALRGPPDDIEPDANKGKVMLTGAYECTIGTISITTYSCGWPQRDADAIVATYTKMVKLADACLAGADKTIGSESTQWRKPHAWNVSISYKNLFKGSTGPGELRVTSWKD